MWREVTVLFIQFNLILLCVSAEKWTVLAPIMLINFVRFKQWQTVDRQEILILYWNFSKLREISYIGNTLRSRLPSAVFCCNFCVNQLSRVCEQRASSMFWRYIEDRRGIRCVQEWQSLFWTRKGKGLFNGMFVLGVKRGGSLSSERNPWGGGDL